MTTCRSDNNNDNTDDRIEPLEPQLDSEYDILFTVSDPKHTHYFL